MSYYIFVENNEIVGKGQAKCLNITNIPVEEDLFEDYEYEKYIYQDGEIVLNPEWDNILIQRETERVGNLTCTKRVFALVLQQFGVSYTSLKELIAQDEQAQLEWDLCVELQRKNPLLDQMASQLSVTSEQLDNLFKFANGEITQDELQART